MKKILPFKTSVLGALLLIMGLYCVLSGMSKEQSKAEGNCSSTTIHTQKSDSARQDEIPVGRTTKQSLTENSCSSVWIQGVIKLKQAFVNFVWNMLAI